MSCPGCGARALPGQDRCPSCGCIVSPPVEGALAPDPMRPTPPARGKVDPLRELPGTRKREPTWKDEVRERVRHRRRQKGGGADLPLFRERESEGSPDELETWDAAPADTPSPAPLPAVAAEGAEAGAGDLPLRPATERALDEEVARAVRKAQGPPGFDEHEPVQEEWPFKESPPIAGPRPVERPAFFFERLRAGGIDLALLFALWSVVVYFASRAARVALPGLRPAWPYLTAYLALLGLTYAGYFTGTTGQTLGKILVGLRVADTAGHPPGYVRAFVRAALGTLGVAVAGLGIVPMFFDPARRALHDRLLRTRVVKG